MQTHAERWVFLGPDADLWMTNKGRRAIESHVGYGTNLPLVVATGLWLASGQSSEFRYGTDALPKEAVTVLVTERRMDCVSLKGRKVRVQASWNLQDCALSYASPNQRGVSRLSVMSYGGWMAELSTSDTELMVELHQAIRARERRTAGAAQAATSEDHEEARQLLERKRNGESLTPRDVHLLNSVGGAVYEEYWELARVEGDKKRAQERAQALEAEARRREEEKDVSLMNRAEAQLPLTLAEQERLRSIHPELHDAWAGQTSVSRPTASPRPEACAIRSPRDAETNAARWMRHLGFSDAEPTAVGADEGIDVAARHAVAQVKAMMTPVGRPDVQNLAGVAAVEGKLGIFFSLSGYTKQAIDWAERAGVALFDFDLMGDPSPVNEFAAELLSGSTTD